MPLLFYVLKNECKCNASLILVVRLFLFPLDTTEWNCLNKLITMGHFAHAYISGWPSAIVEIAQEYLNEPTAE